MGDQKNTIIAIVLSAIVLIVWQFFVGMPQMEKQRQEAQQRQQTQTPAPGPGTQVQPQAQGAGPQLPGQGGAPSAGQQLTREAVLAASPRVEIDTPQVKGSIALKGGRLDDLALKKYRETVNPNSPPIVLFSPSGAPHPFYAQIGWVAVKR